MDGLLHKTRARMILVCVFLAFATQPRQFGSVHFGSSHLFACVRLLVYALAFCLDSSRKLVLAFGHDQKRAPYLLLGPVISQPSLASLYSKLGVKYCPNPSANILRQDILRHGLVVYAAKSILF